MSPGPPVRDRPAALATLQLHVDLHVMAVQGVVGARAETGAGQTIAMF